MLQNLFTSLNDYGITSNKIKKMLLFVAILIISILLINYIFNYLTTGFVNISTNKDNVLINIRDVDDKKTIKSFTISQNSTKKVRLKAAEYIISANYDQSDISQKSKVKARETNEIKFEYDDRVVLKSISPTQLNNITANDEMLYYTTADMGVLRKLDKDGNDILVNNLYQFKKIIWLSYLNGVGLSVEGRLIKINGENLQEIYTPEPRGPINDITYMPQDNGVVNFSDSFDVYQIEDNNAKIVHSGENERIRVLNNRSKLSFSSVKRSEPLREQTHNENNTEASQIYIKQDNSEDFIVKQITGINLDWSNDGSKLVSTGKNNSLTIYDNKLEVLLPEISVNTSLVSWLNNETLLYFSGNKLFSYQTLNSQRKLLTSLATNGNVLSMAPMNSNGPIYVVAKNTNSSQAITTQEVALDGEWPPKNVILATAFLPTTVDNCQISYTNFITLVITIKKLYDSSDCTEVTKNYLTKQLVDSQNFVFKTIN